MIYGSICSGIEAATVAWHPLGWRPAFFSEIDAFPRAVLSHRFPTVPLHGDFTTIQDGDYEPIDLLVGGTPCQGFSNAGKRGGLDDARGNLTLEYAHLARRLRPRWLVWENVPGVFSNNDGADFGAILACFAGGSPDQRFSTPKNGWQNAGIAPPLSADGYGLAWRVLDAQFAGVPQRRRRIYLVGYLGDWRCPAAVLFERHSLQGHSPPSREAGQSVAGALAGVSPGGGRRVGADEAAAGQIIPFDTTQITSPVNRSNPKNGDPCHPLASSAHPPKIAYVPAVAPCLTGNYGKQPDNSDTNKGPMLVAHPSAFGGNNTAGPIECATALVAVAFNYQAGGTQTTIGYDEAAGDSGCLSSNQTPAVCITGDITHTLKAEGFDASEDGTGRGQPLTPAVGGVRRLLPVECERLQGFPDRHTDIPYRNRGSADGPRYKAIGNSKPVPVVRWIGERIQMVEDIIGAGTMP